MDSGHVSSANRCRHGVSGAIPGHSTETTSSGSSQMQESSLSMTNGAPIRPDGYELGMINLKRTAVCQTDDNTGSNGSPANRFAQVIQIHGTALTPLPLSQRERGNCTHFLSNAPECGSVPCFPAGSLMVFAGPQGQGQRQAPGPLPDATRPSGRSGGNPPRRCPCSWPPPPRSPGGAAGTGVHPRKSVGE